MGVSQRRHHQRMSTDAEERWSPRKLIAGALERGNLLKRNADSEEEGNPLKRIAVCRQDDRYQRIAYVSDLRRSHVDGNNRLKRLVDEDGLEKRIVDLYETKDQAEVNGEAPCVMKYLDVEGEEQKLEKRHLEKRQLENPHGDGMRKPHVTQQEYGRDGHIRRGELLNHDNSEKEETSHGPRQSR